MHKYRADIDGLRAVAVSSVVIYHAIPNLVPAGFVGVDIFFVISGFLIGGIIYGDTLDGSFSFANFYARRVRRILPALLAVVLATLLAGLFLLNTHAMKELTSQAFAALFGLSNVYFWDNSDYFATAAVYQPLMMTWSLGIEEQFYVVFPFLMFSLIKLAPRGRIIALLVLIGVSFALSIVAVQRAPVSAFFLLPPRAWELGIGVTLAVMHHEKWIPQASRAVTDLISLVGFALVIASLFLFNHDTSFPGYAVLLPVIGTVMLIHAREGFFNRTLLSWKPVVFVGLISYSWYLWHWPMMAYVRIASDHSHTGGALLSVAAMSFVVAVLSWRYIEQPFRARKLPNIPVLVRYVTVLVAVAAVPVALRLADGVPQRIPHSVVVAEKVRAEGRGTCLLSFDQVWFDESLPCYPEGSRIALLGDSHASAAGVGLERYAASEGTTLAQFSKSGCAPLLGYSRPQQGSLVYARNCADFVDGAWREIASDPDIDTVFIVGSWPSERDRLFRPVVDEKVLPPVESLEAVDRGLRALVSRLHEANKNVVLVGDVPRLDFNPMERVISDGFVARRFLRDFFGLGYKVKDGRVSSQALMPEYDKVGEAVRRIAEEDERIAYYDLKQVFCEADNCLYEKDGKPIFLDQHHLSAFGSRQVEWSDVEFSSPHMRTPS
ncbi:acyltransferase family protein [Hyphomonas pacifica]|uniref:acyltransferase family protein n=1 Tax=Hyphomonas pacifica TaxID=1280941 RepID=UPI000DBF96E8|nr:acyltransferase family protein [Hyphomonas pacifica]RAN33860.1 hypothetical protein HY11_03970 [Hyphomonas pacifica]